MTYIIIIVLVWAWIKYEMENAPLLSEDGDFIYRKSHITFLGIKLFKRKK